MANEISFTTLSSNGGRVSAILSALVAQQLYDPTDLRAVMSFYPWQSAGSDTMSISQDAVPGAYAAASSEISGGGSNSAYTTSKFDLAVARYLKIYQVTDLFGVSGGPIDVGRVVQKLVDGVAITMTDLVCALFGSLSNSVGTSGTNLSIDDLYSAMFQLNSSAVTSTAASPYACVLHPAQINDLRTSLRAEANGPLPYTAASAEALVAKGPGFQFNWNGVDFWQSDSVNTANSAADRAGAMFGQGCFAYTLGDVSAIQGHVPSQNIVVNSGGLLVELERDGANGMTSAIASCYPAVVEAEDSRGVGIVTDA